MFSFYHLVDITIDHTEVLLGALTSENDKTTGKNKILKQSETLSYHRKVWESAPISLEIKDEPVSYIRTKTRA